jgi:hypothetical protein
VWAEESTGKRRAATQKTGSMREHSSAVRSLEEMNDRAIVESRNDASGGDTGSSGEEAEG